MRLSFLFLLGALLVVGCGNSDEEPNVNTAGTIETRELPTTCEDGDLVVVDELLGDGEEATPQDRVFVNYVGMLEDGTVFNDFDNVPFSLGEVVAGFRDGIGGTDGVDGMKVGGQRTLIIPPNMAYGPNPGRGPIPPCATLVFEIELVSIDGAGA